MVTCPSHLPQCATPDTSGPQVATAQQKQKAETKNRGANVIVPASAGSCEHAPSSALRLKSQRLLVLFPPSRLRTFLNPCRECALSQGLHSVPRKSLEAHWSASEFLRSKEKRRSRTHLCGGEESSARRRCSMWILPTGMGPKLQAEACNPPSSHPCSLSIADDSRACADHSSQATAEVHLCPGTLLVHLRPQEMQSTSSGPSRDAMICRTAPGENVKSCRL